MEEQFFTDIKIARLARCARNLWTKHWLRSKHVPELQSNNVQQQIGIFVQHTNCLFVIYVYEPEFFPPLICWCFPIFSAVYLHLGFGGMVKPGGGELRGPMFS